MASRYKARHSISSTKKTTAALQVLALPGLPEIARGHDLAQSIFASAKYAHLTLRSGDVLVVAQKIVSKAEGCAVSLSSVNPSAKAKKIAARLGNDPRLIEVVLRESRRIVRLNDRVLIVETHHGFVCANGGVDRSNVPGQDVVTVLPKNPDRSAKRLSEALHKKTGKRIAVIISDTWGRPWRLGLINVAIGAAGLSVLNDLRGTRDHVGKPLHATILAVADELAAAAGLVMGKSEGTPVVLIRGYEYRKARGGAKNLIRPAHEDLFR